MRIPRDCKSTSTAMRMMFNDTAPQQRRSRCRSRARQSPVEQSKDQFRTKELRCTQLPATVSNGAAVSCLNDNVTGACAILSRPLTYESSSCLCNDGRLGQVADRKGVITNEEFKTQLRTGTSNQSRGRPARKFPSSIIRNQQKDPPLDGRIHTKVRKGPFGCRAEDSALIAK
jgi:hypothetical protein